ncbi:MAG: 4a-hydroxytetrahydrobiopterin dehydratase [Candidatus Micrarchaeota archaeon]|nr:4a-hydroxytetrahydrobiopterin dehydratase [Candidatus Micrarchaeota archaeon]
MDLKGKKCKPCEGGTKPMGKRESAKYLKFVNGWVLEGNKISKEMDFKDFNKAMAFTNKVAAVAEREGHHPDMYLHDWNKLRITTYTHAIGGLSINDFILAAKIDGI